jgi:uncharacterized protein YjiS (DUF1127 family)
MPIAVTNPLINCQCDQPRNTARVRAGQPGITARVIREVQSLVRTLRLWRSRIRERQAFPVLDERALRDLRLSRWDVERELAKPFWRG